MLWSILTLWSVLDAFEHVGALEPNSCWFLEDIQEGKNLRKDLLKSIKLTN